MILVHDPYFYPLKTLRTSRIISTISQRIEIRKSCVRDAAFSYYAHSRGLSMCPYLEKTKTEEYRRDNNCCIPRLLPPCEGEDQIQCHTHKKTEYIVQNRISQHGSVYFISVWRDVLISDQPIQKVERYTADYYSLKERHDKRPPVVLTRIGISQIKTSA